MKVDWKVVEYCPPPHMVMFQYLEEQWPHFQTLLEESWIEYEYLLQLFDD